MRFKMSYRELAVGLMLLSFILVEKGLAHPGAGIAVDREGDVYFAHTGVGVYRIGPEGKLIREKGPGFHYLELDLDGKFLGQRWPRYREPIRPGVIGYGDSVITPVGKSPTLLCASSFPIAMGHDGALYYPDIAADELVHIMRLAPMGKPTDFATLPPAMEISYEGKLEKAFWIHGLAAATDGTLYYAEKESVRRIDPTGKVSAVAEKIVVPGCSLPEGHRGGPVLRELDVAADGTIYAASFACHAVLRITPAGKVDVALKAEGNWSPTGIAVHGGDVYVLEFLFKEVRRSSDWLPRVRKLSSDGTVTVLATVTEAPKD